MVCGRNAVSFRALRWAAGLWLSGLLGVAGVACGSLEQSHARAEATRTAGATHTRRHSAPALAKSAPTPSIPEPAEAPSGVSVHGLGVVDNGIFDDLNQRVALALPRSLTPERAQAVFDRERSLLVLYDDDWPVKVYPVGEHFDATLEVGEHKLGLRAEDAAELKPLLAAARFQMREAADSPRAPTHVVGDRDADGIPDALDVLIGARKTVLNGARYDARFVPLDYPGGDVPRDIGVCTDVVVRALRNAGFDLQQAVHEDIARAPQAYPSVTKANASIDHRRVKSVLPYFARHFERHVPRLDDPLDPLRPGDIVFMDTFPDKPGAEHVGIVSDQLGARGLPLIINNWTEGSVTRAMALLPDIPVTQRFRLPLCAAGPSPISDDVAQLVVVTSPGFDAWRGQLQRYERQRGQAWKAVGEPIAVVLGYAGYAWGDGLHGSGAPPGRPGPLKREGDGRSPAGVFALGTVHGYAPREPSGFTLPYRQAGAGTRCVDDPQAPQYNQVVEASARGEGWRSAERMRRRDAAYELALDIEHNRSPVVPGHGSCIFAHVWAGPDTPVSGCTGMAVAELRNVLSWLHPGAVWVALPAPEYRALRACWSLPDSPKQG